MGCLFIKVVCELGLECCEIVWFIFGVGVRVLRGFFFSMRGLGRMYFWCVSYCVYGKCWVVKCGVDNCWKYLSSKFILRWVFFYFDFFRVFGSIVEIVMGFLF